MLNGEHSSRRGVVYNRCNTPNPVSTMIKQQKLQKKSYALQRMALSIDRAIAAPSRKAKERAARWAAAWGMLGGIKTRKVRLKRLDPRDILLPSVDSTQRSIDLSSSVANPGSRLDRLAGSAHSHQTHHGIAVRSQGAAAGER